ncbi:DNA-binding response regulator, NarL/FixJ family, contains REC and HTH domains [Actinacidiphila alni]|uniref:DNA-binding response regulator, NarL/FixJ family, contains REC and HTH domains n=2 Tax=Actinacidiphila alni TaxID=380248 RepID=A0A1I2F0K2_9ACTN|nr:DNA-binding response regulator, NarL/FixJ family, contains REC and HTH domains [Actinacidiphila alni]
MPFPARLRVVLFMEDQILRLGVQAIMSGLATGVETYFAANEFDFVGKVREHAPDVAVLTPANRRLWDVIGQERAARTGPDRTGRAGRDGRGASGVAGERPSPRLLLVIEQHQTDDLAGLPADGYLIRQDLSAAGMARALDQLAAGEMAIPVELGRSLIQQAASAAPAKRRGALTARENETLVLLVRGLSNKQIGRRLLISEHGAKRLVSSVLLKLDATNRTSAVVKAIRTGLVDEATLADTAN